MHEMKRQPERRLLFAMAACLALLGATGQAAAQDLASDPQRFMAAVKAGATEQVRSLAASGADLNARQGDGAGALHWAAHRDYTQMVRLLLDSGADVDAQDDHGVTPLALASLNASEGVAAMLLEAGADANLARSTGVAPIITAARVGSSEVVRELIRHGADVNAAERSRGQTALMWAIAENHSEVARLLVEAGAAVTVRTKHGFTPLLFAAQQGNVEVAQLLLAAGADVNESAPDGIGGNTNAFVRYTDGTQAHTLLVAIDSAHREIALFLLEQGADPNHNGAGRTPLHSAVQQKMPEVVEALLARGADPNARLERPLPYVSRAIKLDNGLLPTPIGATPFWLAASYADTEIMRLLVDGGADPLLTSNDSTTPLMVAAGADFVEGQDKYGRRWFGEATPLQERALEAVKLCLELGADINSANDNEQTALHGAVYYGGTILTRFLVERGADIDAINRRGQTAWMIAAQGEYRAGSFYTHHETAEVLAELGADTTLGFDLGKDFEDVLAARDEADADRR